MLMMVLPCIASWATPCGRLGFDRVSCGSRALRWQSAPWLQLLLLLLLLGVCTCTPECIWARRCLVLYLNMLVVVAVELRWRWSLPCLRCLRRRHNVRRLWDGPAGCHGVCHPDLRQNADGLPLPSSPAQPRCLHQNLLGCDEEREPGISVSLVRDEPFHMIEACRRLTFPCLRALRQSWRQA